MIAAVHPETQYSLRVRALEAEGLTTSDAQGIADLEGLDDVTPVLRTEGPWKPMYRPDWAYAGGGRPWFVEREHGHRYEYLCVNGPRKRMRAFATEEAAQRAADDHNTRPGGR